MWIEKYRISKELLIQQCEQNKILMFLKKEHLEMIQP